MGGRPGAFITSKPHCASAARTALAMVHVAARVPRRAKRETAATGMRSLQSSARPTRMGRRGPALRDLGLAGHSPQAEVQNQWSCIRIRNSRVIGKPEAVPITESISHFGQRAVWPSSIHSEMSVGGKMAKQ